MHLMLVKSIMWYIKSKSEQMLMELKHKKMNSGKNTGLQRKCHTHLGTVESLVIVVGSSSKTDAMSCPWGTETRQYTGVFGLPRNLVRIASGIGSSST